MEGANVAPWLVSLVVDGIIGGVGGVLGFLPIIATLYLFMAILEDIGYMSRIAFILDRIFRKDRKSTRLNSSHANISYAVFCLKKKQNLKSSLLNSSHHTISY